MKRLIVAVLLLSAACSCGSLALRTGSYNLWRSDLGKDDYAWNQRKHRLVLSIKDIDYDLFGAEEVDTTMIRELPLLFKEAGLDYEIFIFSPYRADGGTGNKAQAIIYKPSRLKMLGDHHFWFSETPDTISGGWDEMKFRRGGCCAQFKDLKSGRSFFFMLSHMPLGPEANEHAAHILLQRAEMYNPEQLPAIFVGDLNTRPDSPSSQILRSYWTDVYQFLPAGKRQGPQGTFNSHNVEKDMESAQRIDYIYFRGSKIAPRNYCCFDRLYDGLYPSDHCAIYSDIIILK
ncbi:MAG: endonuclease/exonuclease/phosphatase family protein [Bacteroidales bacterium]|nr:endonuclease/exonuclease/phosphatase family protein [Bacteroidales bacterium]